MIKVKIIQNKKEVKNPEEFLSKQMETMVSLYDPLGLHTIESPYYVEGVLWHLKKFKEIDSYEILIPASEFPEIESEPGVVY